MAKNQAIAKKHYEAELLLFENHSLSSSMLQSKNDRAYCQKYAKKQMGLLNEIIWFDQYKNLNNLKNRSHRYDINRSRARHGYRYTYHK